MIVIIGASGSGKTTLQKMLCNKLNYTKTLTTTTRPIRFNEIGNEYNFVTIDEFKSMVENSLFIEHSFYNGWGYGSSIDQIQNRKVSVVTPCGLRILKRYIKDNGLENKIQLHTIYLKVDEKSRLIKLLNTRDDVFEQIRRTMCDVGMFDGVEHEVDLVIDNREYRHSVNTICEHVIDFFGLIQKEANLAGDKYNV